MIKINLLPKKRQETKTQDASGGSRVRYQLLGTLACSVAVICVIYGICSNGVENRRSQIAGIKKQIEAKRPLSEEFASIENERKQVVNRITVINKIREGRAIAPKLLYDLSTISKDNLWLKKLSKEDEKFSLEGRSVDNETLCGFVERLSKLPYMKNVELKSVEDVTESNMTVKKFIVGGSVS
jgi:type IV pilus assembly protein PilN